MEPTYTYVKGEGWVPEPTTGRFRLLYRSSPSKEWRDAQHDGCIYKSYDEAYRDMTTEYRLSRQAKGWQYRIEPA